MAKKKAPEVKEETVKIKITKHPREMFYEGRSTRDHMEAQLNYLNSSPTVPDMAIIKPFIQSLRVDDIVGVEHNQYKVLKVTEDNFIGLDMKRNDEFIPEYDRLTMAIGCGFAEILYRDNKPYGIEQEKEVKIKIVNHTKNNK